MTANNASEAPSIPDRINVAVNAEEVAALRLIIEREGVTLTEAVRRLIGYGSFAYRAARVEGQQLLTRSEGAYREWTLL